MKKRFHILYILLTLSGWSFAQSVQSPFTIWKLTSITGQANLKGNYRTFTSTVNDIVDKQNERFANAIIQVRAQSYFVHPNFMLVNVNALYNPETRRRNYIGVPDNNEKNNREGVDISALFFQKKNFNLSANASTYTNLQNIDNLSKVKEKITYWGATFSDRNKIMPFTVSYNKQNSDQKILETDRTYQLNQEIYQINSTKSFGLKDHHSFNYLHTNNYSNQLDTSNITSLKQNNKVEVYELNNDISFGKKSGITYASGLASTIEKGDLNYKNNSIQQSLSIRLPYHFSLINTYNYRRANQDTNRLDYNRYQSILSHQLFASLTSRVNFEHWESKQATYDEKRDKVGADFRYQKKIPKGKIIISYGYNKEFQSVSTPTSTIYTFHDEYILIDNVITMLRKQYIEFTSVVVKDVTGNIIYQPNLDYILINHDPYIEIVRVPGGLIPNNGKVYIDYTSKKPGANKYAMSNQSLVIDVWSFKSILNAYYRMYQQNYDNQVISDFQVLNTETRHVLGTKLDLHTMSAGIEYEFCKSNILPYSSLKYFFTFQKNIRKFMVLANGNYTNYIMGNEESRRKDLNLQGKFSYTISPTIKTNLDYAFRSMKGHGINININSVKFEITSQLRKLYISTGTELYSTKSAYSKSNYKEIFVQQFII